MDDDDDYKILLDAVNIIIADIWIHFRFVTHAVYEIYLLCTLYKLKLLLKINRFCYW